MRLNPKLVLYKVPSSFRIGIVVPLYPILLRFKRFPNRQAKSRLYCA